MYQYSVKAERFVLGLNFVFSLIYICIQRNSIPMTFEYGLSESLLFKQQIQTPILDLKSSKFYTLKNYLLVQFMISLETHVQSPKQLLIVGQLTQLFLFS